MNYILFRIYYLVFKIILYKYKKILLNIFSFYFIRDKDGYKDK